MGADEQPNVLELQPRLGERPLELVQPAGLVKPGIDEYDAAAGRDRIGVHVRDAGPRERQAQTPDACHDAVGSS